MLPSSWEVEVLTPPPPTQPPLVQEVLAPLALVPAQPDPKEPKGREDPKGRPWRGEKSFVAFHRLCTKADISFKKWKIQSAQLHFFCCWEFSFKDVFFLVGFSNIFHTWMDGNALVLKFSSIMLLGDLFLPISSMPIFFSDGSIIYS